MRKPPSTIEGSADLNRLSLSRRSLLRGGATAIAAALLNACGADTTPNQSATSTTAAESATPPSSRRPETSASPGSMRPVETEAPQPSSEESSPSTSSSSSESEAESSSASPEQSSSQEGVKRLTPEELAAMTPEQLNEYATLESSLLENPQKLVEDYYSIRDSLLGACVTENELSKLYSTEAEGGWDGDFIALWNSRYSDALNRIDFNGTAKMCEGSCGGVDSFLTVQDVIAFYNYYYSAKIPPLSVVERTSEVISSDDVPGKSVTVSYATTPEYSLTEEDQSYLIENIGGGASMDYADVKERRYTTRFELDSATNSLRMVYVRSDDN